MNPSDPSFLVNIALVFGTFVVLLIGWAIITYMRREAHGLNTGRQDDLAAAIREARSQMTDEEFERVRESLRRQGLDSSKPSLARDGREAALHTFEESLARGEISPEEFARLRDKLRGESPADTGPAETPAN